MTSLLSFMAGLRGSSWASSLSLVGGATHSSVCHIAFDTSDLFQCRHKHPAVMSQGLAGRTLRISPPHTATHLYVMLDPSLWERVRIYATSGGKITTSCEGKHSWCIMSLSHGMEDACYHFIILISLVSCTAIIGTCPGLPGHESWCCHFVR